MLGDLYSYWNERINIISRKDIENLYTNHVLHSLAIGKFIHPVAGTSFIDIGTGGGFPGIPLAILFPDCQFHLIDRIGKKINVVNNIVGQLHLTNVTTQHGDLGECRKKFDFAVTRGVAKIDILLKIARNSITRTKPANAFPNGIIALKGGELQEELSLLKIKYFDEPLSQWFDEPFFETKHLIYIPL